MPPSFLIFFIAIFAFFLSIHSFTEEERRKLKQKNEEILRLSMSCAEIEKENKSFH